ncbi:MAG TPA: DUF4389 domain-containing protein [Solirubrobacterales bacterium]
MQPEAYPVTFSVEYPERALNRVSTAFRIFAVIPIAIVAVLLEGGNFSGGSSQGGFYFSGAAAGGGLVVLPIVLMLLFRKKYPRWWYAWNLEFLRFSNRIGIYLALMDDRYPSTDELQAVRLDFPYPNAAELSRGLPLVKWLLAIPHYVVLFFLYIGAFFAVIGAWFAILFTGRYPRGIFRFVEGVIRWQNRVYGYAFVLVTDKYPPFRLSP